MGRNHISREGNEYVCKIGSEDHIKTLLSNGGIIGNGCDNEDWLR